jgi:cobyric acid synthase
MVCNFLLNFLKLSEKGFTEEDILKICGVIQVNGQEVRDLEKLVTYISMFFTLQ